MLNVTSCSSNMKFDSVINFREVMVGSNVFRSACVTKASSSDIVRLKDDLKINTFIDLRSSQELKDDTNIVPFLNAYYGTSFVGKDFLNEIKIQKVVNTSLMPVNYYSIPLISELQVARYIFSILPFVPKVQILALLLPALLIPQAKLLLRKQLAKTMNQGGLKLLYEIILDTSGKRLAQVFRVLASERNWPAVVFCTAGKDRTGIVSMLYQSLRGVSSEAIIEDYHLSRNVYKEEMEKDDSTTIASLKQVDLDTEIMFDAPKEVMSVTLRYLSLKYTSAEKYLIQHGLDQQSINTLKE